MKTRAFISILACLALVAPARAAVPTTPVVFNWFEYTGRDLAFAQPLPPGHYRNPILAGFYPDPSICRVGDDYYLVNSTFVYFPGIPVFHSRDLVHWAQIGNVINRPGQVKFDGLGVSRGVFAPAISQHDGIFYLLNTLVDCGGNCLFTAKDPAGPWSDPVFLDFDGIDPSFFFDDDSRAWLVNNGAPEGPPLYQGHRAIWIQEFNLATHKLTGPRTMIVNGGVDLAKKPVWIEGPHVFKRDSWYYLCCAEGGTSLQHSQVVLRSKSVTGPYVPWEKNPILTQRDLDGTAPGAVTCTGHAQLVVGPDGNWWSVFLGCRPFDGHYWTTGRETFLLPVTWTDDGWPAILPPRERVPYVMTSPKTPPHELETGPASLPALPLTGNFTWHDDFFGSALSPAWLMLREPHETWWEVGPTAGHLSLLPRPDTLAGKTNPTFLARRVQHARFTATTALVPPAEPDVSAGLALFQSETHFYRFGVRRDANGLRVFVDEANGAAPRTIARAPLPGTGHVKLRITADDRTLAFAYAIHSNHWQTLVPNADTVSVTVQAAGDGLHFTGAVVGLFAQREP